MAAMYDNRELTKRALVNRAVAALVEIEHRTGRHEELTAIIGGLLEYGKRHDAEDDKCVECGGLDEAHQANYYCRQFRGR